MRDEGDGIGVAAGALVSSPQKVRGQLRTVKVSVAALCGCEQPIRLRNAVVQGAERRFCMAEFGGALVQWA